ncbi:MAG: PAS domain S-box protein [Myxococcales bacterium]
MGRSGSRTEDAGETSFRTLCETCGVGFWHIDKAGRTVYVNAAMCALLEADSAAELEGVGYHRFFTEESLVRMREEHAKRTTGAPSTYEAVLIGLRGGRRSVVISGAPLTDSAGELQGLIGTFTDITARKQAELALQDSENRLRSVFAASNDAIAVARAGVLMMVNPALLRMFRCIDEDELRGHSVLELITPASREDVAEGVRLRAEGKQQVGHYFTTGIRRNGEEFPLEVRAAVYQEADAFYSVAILRDNTERMALEEQLRQSQKMDALGRLAGGVAHDFNNLLMVMMGCSEMILADQSASAKVRHNAQLTVSTGERAVSLTRQLLALSRRQVIDPRVIDLDGVVQEMADMLRRLLGPQIELVVKRGDATARVKADPGQIQQVVMNLCVNARDAMPEGGRITLETEHVRLSEGQLRSFVNTPAGDFIRLAVSDTGHGMDAATQERLFEPFFTTKPLGEGTGLGLSTVYGIVKQSGGHITVNSSVGEGSVFYVYLPRVDAPLAAPPAARSIPPAPHASDLTVLLVEDEASVRALVGTFLGAIGYKVIAASSGEEALSLFARRQAVIKLVVTDMLMPGMSGAVLANELDRVAPGLPILFVSGYPRDSSSTLVTARPRSAFLAKPFTPLQLKSQLQQLLAAGADGGRLE